MKHLKYLGLGLVSSNGWIIMVIVLLIMRDVYEFLIGLLFVLIVSYLFGLYHFKKTI